MAAAGLAARQLLVAAVLGLTCFAVGRRILLRWRFSGIADEIAMSVGLGMGVFATGLFALAAIGRLDRAWLFAMLALTHVLCLRAWTGVPTRIAAVLRRARTRRGALAVVLAFALALAAAFVLGLYPYATFDATMYHIPFAQALAREHRLVFLPDLRFPIFPQLGEILFAAVLLVAPGSALHVVEWTAMVVSAAAIFGWARRRSSSRGGTVAAAAWLGGPIVLFLGGVGMIDLVMVAFFVLAGSAWSLGRVSGSWRWLLLSGLFAGFTAATKYQGLIAALGLGALTLLAGYGRRRIRPLLGFAFAGLVSLGPWYARNLIATGNPVFPLMTGLFGRNAWSVSYDRIAAAAVPGAGRLAGAVALPIRAVGGLLHPLRLLALPAQLVFDRAALKGEPPFSPAFLPMLAVVLAAAFRNRTVVWLVAFAAALAAMFGTYEIRFLLPSAALLSVACGLSYEPVLARGCPEPERGRFPALLLTALLAPGILYAGYQIRKHGPIPATEQARRAYLDREVPGYAAIDLLNRRLGSGYSVYAMYGEYLPAYARGRIQGQWAGPASFHTVRPVLKSGESLASRLEALGCGFLLALHDRFPVRLPGDEVFRRRFRRVYRDEASELYELRGP